MAVDTAVTDVECRPGNCRALGARDRHGGRVANGRQPRADVRHEVGDLARRDHRTPDGHVGPSRICRLAQAVLDDRGQLRNGQRLPDLLEPRHVWRDTSAPLHSVAGRAGELDEQVRSHQHVRAGRLWPIRLGTTAPGTTCQPAQTDSHRAKSDGGTHDGSRATRHARSIDRGPDDCNAHGALSKAAYLRSPRSMARLRRPAPR
jgi:hypothetical protein